MALEREATSSKQANKMPLELDNKRKGTRNTSDCQCSPSVGVRLILIGWFQFYRGVRISFLIVFSCERRALSDRFRSLGQNVSRCLRVVASSPRPAARRVPKFETSCLDSAACLHVCQFGDVCGEQKCVLIIAWREPFAPSSAARHSFLGVFGSLEQSDL